MEITFILVKQEGEIEVKNNHGLADDSELAKIPDIGIMVIYMGNKHETINDK